MKNFKEWIHDHDDRWSFIIPYIGGAILLSIFMSLFWVTMLMLAHFALEVWRHRLLGIPNPYIHALWHTKLDFSLIILAFAIAVYAEALFAALGLGQAARGAQMATRLGVIERGLRAGLMTIDEAGLFLRALAKGKRKQADGAEAAAVCLDQAEETPAVKRKMAAHQEMADEDPAPWRSPTKGDWASIGFAVACVTLILAAPALTGGDLGGVGRIILEELHP